MSDIATQLIQDVGSFRFDWAVGSPGLATDEGLQTSVIISLFTDRRADADDLPASAAGSDRRGWWGDSYADVEGDRIGSRLWLLAREKQTTATLLKARDFAAEALQWLIDDGLARAINVKAEWQAGRQGVLLLTVEIVRAGKPVNKYQFEAFWKGN
ncbi:phage GP46 family protein [Polaromonas sp. JS666]|uniref:phage GP46 family protein n=1 Tax=Polaromonas sp. (strain JS666 / ATCC BAA-500) TaxID=296591 RepID=UPI0000464B69|nr:phage GP46 family protein [Polaromonas sp. JS666]ABE45633.1 phage GP46 [Polaromonas sp. JS666]